MSRVPVSGADMAGYRAGARKRRRQQEELLREHLARARELAAQAAELLKKEFGASEVLVFGSVTQPARFHAHSDLDLAAWGIEADLYLRAVGRLLSLDPQFLVDLVRMEEAPDTLRAVIERTGVSL